ncbi:MULTISPECIES: zinc metallopeptidase [Peptoniphilus]|uniref:zinc metallopeptidase n=1 Tax=Peptoniphilus TaxID=162289 RepID=UPI0001DA9C08|nr:MULTISPECIES: zinc metallopeptidase [Peptoniphilus]EFI42197.1 putative neutral zinc metallopeptidase [Peptoniphilus sp. oral taxon 386 str. F0131]
MFGYGYYGIGFQYMYYIIPGLLLAMFAQSKINSTYEKYRRIDSNTGLTGADVARLIMDRNNLRDVRIQMIGGKLSDNYDPENKVLNLSSDIYSGRSIAALGIAAHEVGHAIQHERGYIPLKIRAALVPAANIGSNLSMIFIMMGLFFSAFMIKLGIAMFAIAVLFQIVTLPVEFDASRRAQAELSNNILSVDALVGTKEVLSAAALTYVASTLIALGQLFRLLALFGKRRD